MHRLSAWLAVLVLVAPLSVVRAQGPWRTGRATHYGGVQDPWSIMTGSCGYGYLDPAVSTGWDVAALTDAVSEYQGSCGRCFEVACQGMQLTDGYGSSLDRTSVCHDPDASVVVMITDSCPCNYPDNQYSNKRWCCGDYFHLDMSDWAFEKLAALKWGVIGLKFREVPCSYTPQKPAKLPGGQNPSVERTPKPWDWQPSNDKRPGTGAQPVNPYSGTKDGKGSDGWSTYSGAPPGGAASASANAGTGGSTSAGSAVSTGVSSASGGSLSFPMPPLPMPPLALPTVQSIFSGGSLLSNWLENSWSFNTWQAPGVDSKGSAMCGTASGHGAASYTGPPGLFKGKSTLQFAIKKDSSGNVPDFTVSLQSPKGACRTFSIRGMNPQWSGDWATFTIQLQSFSWLSSWVSSPTPFWQCSSTIDAYDINQVTFKSASGGSQWICIDALKVLGQ